MLLFLLAGTVLGAVLGYSIALNHDWAVYHLSRRRAKKERAKLTKRVVDIETNPETLKGGVKLWHEL